MFNLIGRKLGMTQFFTKDQKIIPITLIELLPSQILKKKTIETDGYNALVLGYQDRSKKNLNKSMLGFFLKLNVTEKKYIYELRVDKESDLEKHIVHDYIGISVFKNVTMIDIQGKTKGKGFQGVIKMHNFSRGPMSHGSDHHRRPGSIGALGPERVLKGKKLPGKMGNVYRTIQNLKIVELNEEKNLIYVKGSIPGPKNSIIKIRKSIKKLKELRE